MIYNAPRWSERPHCRVAEERWSPSHIHRLPHHLGFVPGRPTSRRPQQLGLM